MDFRGDGRSLSVGWMAAACRQWASVFMKSEHKWASVFMKCEHEVSWLQSSSDSVTFMGRYEKVSDFKDVSLYCFI